MISNARLEHFRSHVDTDVPLPERGIIALLGPNGTGKTNFIEGILWSWLGLKAVRKNLDGLRSKVAPLRKAAGATTHFAHRGHRYELRRTENGAVLIIDNREDDPRATGTTGVTVEMEEVLGITADEFLATHVCSQKDLTKLRDLGPTGRIEFVLGLLQISEIDEAIDRARAIMRELSAEKTGLASTLGDAALLKKEHTEAQRAAQSAKSALEKAARHLESSINSRAVAAEQARKLANQKHQNDLQWHSITHVLRGLDELAAKIAETEIQLASARSARSELTTIASQTNAIEQLTKDRDFLMSTAPDRDRAKSLNEARSRITDAITDVNASIARLQADYDPDAAAFHAATSAALEKAHDHLAALRSDRASRRAAAEATGKIAAQRINTLTVQIAELKRSGPSGLCPLCQESLADHYSTALATLNQQRADAITAREAQGSIYRETNEPGNDEAEADAEYERCKRSHQTAEAALRASDRAYERLTATRSRKEELHLRLNEIDTELSSLTIIDDLDARLDQTTSEIQRLADLHHRTAELRAQSARRPELSATLTELRTPLTAAIADHRDIYSTLHQIGYSPTTHRAATDDLEASTERYRLATLAETESKATLNEAHGRLERAIAAIEADEVRRAEVREFDDSIATLEGTIAELKRFRATEIAQVLPDLEGRTAHYVATLSDGRYSDVSLSEDFQITLIESGDAMEVVSGGSEDIAALALRLALAEIADERRGHSIPLLILDEPFAYLAAEWRRNALAMLRSLQNRFPQIFLSSHDPNVHSGVDHSLFFHFDPSTRRTYVTTEDTPLDYADAA